MKNIGKEFKKAGLLLDLKGYLTLTKKKILISLVFAILTFISTWTILIYLLINMLNSSNEDQINKIILFICLLILPCLISLNYSLWLASLFFNINKLKNNLDEVKKWSLRKKKKYLRTFLIMTKINFLRRNTIEVTKEMETIFQEYMLSASKHSVDYYTNGYVLEPVVETITLFFDDFIIFYLIWGFSSLIFCFWPMLWIYLKNALHLNFFKAKGNENTKNNFRTIANSFLQVLGIEKEMKKVIY